MRKRKSGFFYFKSWFLCFVEEKYFSWCLIWTFGGNCYHRKGQVGLLTPLKYAKSRDYRHKNDIRVLNFSHIVKLWYDFPKFSLSSVALHSRNIGLKIKFYFILQNCIVDSEISHTSLRICRRSRDRFWSELLSWCIGGRKEGGEGGAEKASLKSFPPCLLSSLLPIRIILRDRKK